MGGAPEHRAGAAGAGGLHGLALATVRQSVDRLAEPERGLAARPVVLPAHILGQRGEALAECDRHGAAARPGAVLWGGQRAVYVARPGAAALVRGVGGVGLAAGLAAGQRPGL